MKPLTLLLAGILVFEALQAQDLRIEMPTVMNASGQPVSDGMMIYGSESLKKQLKYSDIKGHPFDEPAFRWVRVYDKALKPLAIVRGRLNLYANTLHYLNEQAAELALGADFIGRLDFLDSLQPQKVLAVYESGVYGLETKLRKPVFTQVLNEGEIRLLYFRQKYVSTYDSLMGTIKRNMFATRYEYLLQKKNTVESLKKLNKERVMAFVRNEAVLLPYAEANKLDFRKEEDVVTMLNYLNAQLPKS